jgi:tetratricopeptide (TPR) repeat protein
MNSTTASIRWRRFIGTFVVWLIWLAVAAGTHGNAAPKKSGDQRAPAARGQQHATDVTIDDHGNVPKDLLLPPEEERKADALAAFVDGLIAEENADGDRTLAAFQKVLNLDPGYTELAVKVAYEQARRGDVDQGISTLKDAIKARPKDPEPCLFLSQLYSRYLRKPDQAQKYAQKALDLDPKNFGAYRTLHELYATTNQPKKADAILEKAASVETDDPHYWIQLAELYTKVLLKEDGSGSPESLKKLNSALEKALAAAKDDPLIIARVADFHVLSRQVKSAIPLYLSVLKLRKNAPPELAIATVQDKLARSFRINGQRDEAIAILQELIKDNPLRYESYELLGELHEEKGEFEKALANYQQALLIDGSQPINHLRVADMLLKSKDVTRAVTVLQDARKKFPDLPQFTYSLAVALSQAKRYQEAVPLFEEALHEAEEKQQEMLNAAFYFSYGAASERAGLFEKAGELLRKSIALDPANAAEAYNYLGYMWVEKGENLDEAGDLIRRALEMDPDNAAFIDSLGWYHFKKGEYEKALEQLLKAAELMKPEDAVVFEHVADTYARLKKMPEALAYWQRAAALDPENKAVREKMESAKQKITLNPPGAHAPAN